MTIDFPAHWTPESIASLRQEINAALSAAERRGFERGREAARKVCQLRADTPRHPVSLADEAQACANAINKLQPPAPGGAEK